MSSAAAGWLQFALLVAALAACYVPLGNYMARIFTSKNHWRVERGVYKLCGIDPEADMRWSVYVRSLLAFSLVCVLFLYLIERTQHWLFLSAGMVVEAGQVIPGDGDVVQGVASVDESAITGESAPVIRESGGDRSAVTGGTTVLSDRIVVRITSKPGETFIDRMIALVEGAKRQKTPNEIALNILLASLTIIFLLAVITLQPRAGRSGSSGSPGWTCSR